MVWAPGLSAEDLEARLAGPFAAVVPNYRPTIITLSFETLFARDAGEATFQAPIAIAFGVATFIIVAIGVFGLVSYLIGQRRRELAIRVALGAEPRRIRNDIARQIAMPTAFGVVTGCFAAAGLERAIEATVFGWKSSGLGAMTIVAIALACVALLAVVGPMRRALRCEPAAELRAE